MRNKSPRRVTAIGATSIIVGMLLVSVPAEAGIGNRVPICHRTHSQTNPYRRITVSKQAAGHNGHTGPVWVLGSPGWGDIIPSGYQPMNQQNYTNNVAGQAIHAGLTTCRGRTAIEFITSEVAAGQLMASVLADLDEQGATEDAATLAALGGTFSAALANKSLSEIQAALAAATPVVVTGGVSDLNNVSASLSGTINPAAAATTLANFFEYGTDPLLVGATRSAATPTSATGATTTSISLAVSGLAPSTTYYYRAVGEYTDTLSAATVDYPGLILSFATPAAPTTSTTTTSTTTTSTTTTSSTSTTSTSTTTVPEPTTVPEETTTTTTPTSTTTVPEPTTTVEPTTVPEPTTPTTVETTTSSTTTSTTVEPTTPTTVDPTTTPTTVEPTTIPTTTPTTTPTTVPTTTAPTTTPVTTVASTIASTIATTVASTEPVTTIAPLLPFQFPAQPVSTVEPAPETSVKEVAATDSPGESSRPTTSPAGSTLPSQGSDRVSPTVPTGPVASSVAGSTSGRPAGEPKSDVVVTLVNGAAPLPVMAGEPVRLSGLVPGAPISVVDVHGTTVVVSTVAADGAVVLPVLPVGEYIMRTLGADSQPVTTVLHVMGRTFSSNELALTGSSTTAATYGLMLVLAGVAMCLGAAMMRRRSEQLD